MVKRPETSFFAAMTHPRRQFFFWLGVFVLPVFWSWFTLMPGFTRAHRGAAISWLGIWSAGLWMCRADLMLRAEILAFTYPFVIGWTTIALGVWLLVRMRFLPTTFIEYFVLVTILPLLSPSIWFMEFVGKPFHIIWLLPLLVLMIAHLLCDVTPKACAKQRPAL